MRGDQAIIDEERNLGAKLTKLLHAHAVYIYANTQNKRGGGGGIFCDFCRRPPPSAAYFDPRLSIPEFHKGSFKIIKVFKENHDNFVSSLL